MQEPVRQDSEKSKDHNNDVASVTKSLKVNNKILVISFCKVLVVLSCVKHFLSLATTEVMIYGIQFRVLLPLVYLCTWGRLELFALQLKG